jgi:hypothetical protein
LDYYGLIPPFLQKCKLSLHLLNGVSILSKSKIRNK